MGTHVIAAEDKLSEARALVEALGMATSGLAEAEQREALQALARIAGEHITAATGLLAKHRSEGEAATVRNPLLAIEPDLCSAHNAALLAEAAVDQISDQAERNLVAYSVAQIVEASDRARQRVYGLLGNDSARMR